MSAFAGAWVGLLLEVDPIPTWFYVFAWYPALVMLDEATVALGGHRLLTGWRRLGSLFGWSAAIWLVFEAANFRLANWYYVFLPRHPAERWVGIVLSFATVVPALVLMTRVLDACGRSARLTSAPLPLPPGRHWVPAALGILMLVLALGRPATFFPLVWGGVWLTLEPFVWRDADEDG